ncbi:endosialin [Esox lucius]|uniref:CD248 molecule, endosialin a n=1 Tax=Esox lucius TaxID=8010 RepID=A0AAY5KXM8_ESOLU|nr:endosialin [Esox lucius]
MGEMSCALRFCALLAVLGTCWPPQSLAQELQEQDALCTAVGCYAVYFQRKTFRESARFCKDKGGYLATLRSSEEVTVVHELLSLVEQRGPRARVRVWIGLHRQPRQCSASRPLRGFQWITGEQDTPYTNWVRADSPNTCAAPRCVVMTVNTAAETRDQADNFKWLEGSCMLPVDGFMCYFPYRGMCPTLKSEGGGRVLYTTPFGLLSTVLTHVPFGSVANMPCPDGEERVEDQSVLCMLREDGYVGWSKDTPLCSQGAHDWCEEENGGCEHFCQNAGAQYYCECSEGFTLAEDDRTCQLDRSCGTANCEFNCEETAKGYRCKCPNGYLLAPNGHNCLDVDECLQTPCPHICVNVPGTFECRCNEGYEPDEDGECVDIDECKESSSCEHQCENTAGSFTCRCRQGFAKLPGDSDLCQDIDECQISTSCEQLCLNYVGGFECVCEAGFELQADQRSCIAISEGDDEYSAATLPYQTSITWAPEFPDFIPGITPLEWLPEQTITERLPTDLGWFTEAPQEETISTAIPNRPSEDHNLPWDVLTRKKPAQDPVTPSASSSKEDDNTNSQAGDPAVVLRVSDGQRPAVKNDKGVGSVVETLDSDPGVKATPTRFSVPPQAQTTTFAPEDEQSESRGKKKHDKSWLLVALLVPLCVFIVVMLALGIVYCTSCAVEQNKSITDCYRWIITSKSEDKNKAKSRA